MTRMGSFNSGNPCQHITIPDDDLLPASCPASISGPTRPSPPSFTRQQQYPAALAVLDAQLGADPRRIDTWLHAAQVQLRVGDLPGAEASVASAAFLAGEAEGPAAAHGMRAVRHARGLLAVARQDWPAAAAAFSSCLREDARDAEAVGDLAVCQLFNRNVESGVAVLEAGFQAQPWAMLKVCAWVVERRKGRAGGGSIRGRWRRRGVLAEHGDSCLGSCPCRGACRCCAIIPGVWAFRAEESPGQPAVRGCVQRMTQVFVLSLRCPMKA